MKGTLSIPQYAEYRGVALYSVQTAIKSGRLKQSVIIVNGRKRINPTLADKEWEKNTNIAKNPTRAKPSPSGDDGFYAHRSKREEYEAKLAQLEYEQKSGKLVNADEVRVDAFNAARACRDALLAVPDRLVPMLIGMNDSFEMNRIITAEMRKICEDFSRATEKA